MTYENYINEPMSMCERKININIARNPHLINSLDRNKKPASYQKKFLYTISKIMITYRVSFLVDGMYDIFSQLYL